MSRFNSRLRNLIFQDKNDNYNLGSQVYNIGYNFIKGLPNHTDTLLVIELYYHSCIWLFFMTRMSKYSKCWKGRRREIWERKWQQSFWWWWQEKGEGKNWMMKIFLFFLFSFFNFLFISFSQKEGFVSCYLHMQIRFLFLTFSFVFSNNTIVFRHFLSLSVF